MRSKTEIVYLLILWIFEYAILPPFLLPGQMPRLILSGIVVLALSDDAGEPRVAIFVLGLWLDLISGLLVGANALGLLAVYESVRAVKYRFLPSGHKIWQALALTVIASVFLDFFLFGYGFFAVKFGWPVMPENFWHLSLRSLFRLLWTCGLTFAIFLMWQEISHRLRKPLIERG